MSEILSIESIQRAARIAAGRGQRDNPYPEIHPAHDVWAQAHVAASPQNAFAVLTRPSVMNTPKLRRVAADQLAMVRSFDGVTPRRGGFLIDPTPQASADKRAALLRGGI